MAGFGTAGGGMASTSKKGKKKKETNSIKLKPRKQWDRFLSQELETSDRIRVAVRVLQVQLNDDNNNDDNENKWFSVGEIKSKDNMYTEASVIRHRVLIADHARRIYPAEIRINDKLDWGYNININTNSAKDDEKEKVEEDNNDENDNDDWTIVQKLDDMPNDIDKLIGFQGYADPTGFYSSTGTFRSKASGNMKQTGYSIILQ